MRENPSYSSLWTGYTLNKEAALGTELKILMSLMSFPETSQSLNTQCLRSFGNYVFSIAPELKSGREHRFYQELGILEGFKKSQFIIEPNYLLAIEEGYQSTNKRDLPLLVSSALSYLEVGQYAKTMEILQDALDRVGDSPFRFEILIAMASVILEAGDIEKLPQAAEYLNLVWTEFGRINQPVMNTTFSLPANGNEPAINRISDLDVYYFYELKVAFDILDGNFDEAYRFIKETHLTEEWDLDSDALKKALHLQIHKMPKKLRKLVGRDIIAFAGIDIHSQRQALECSETYKILSKGHSNEKKIKKLLKDNEKNIAMSKDSSDKDKKEEKDKKDKKDKK
ncbi:MAG: hypothetical protein H0X26_03125 [Alphaproteobacteria bacterium]|nr:hypothetical protein [Alphaproteobacteria bacterium]